MGYDRAVSPIGSPPLLTTKQIREALQDDIARARRRFGTAVMHTSTIDDTIYIDITARRDPKSALWGRWIIRKTGVMI